MQWMLLYQLETGFDGTQQQEHYYTDLMQRQTEAKIIWSERTERMESELFRSKPKNR